MKKKKLFTLNELCLMGILGGISAVVMLFEIPLWFAPSFYELDFSEIIVLVGGFALGPLAAVIIELIKIIVNTIITGSSTAFVGEFANFVMGVAFVLPATLIYKYKKSKLGAILGLLVSVIVFSIVGCFVNYYIMIPLYAELYMPLDVIIAMGTEINGNINNLFTFIIFATLPFNVVKGLLCSVITMVIYKKISPFLRKQLDRKSV